MELNYVGADIALETFVVSRRDGSKKGYGVVTVSNTDESICEWAQGLEHNVTVWSYGVTTALGIHWRQRHSSCVAIPYL